MEDKKLNIAVMFGGRCLEHEISVISALQLIKAIDDQKYNLIPVYIAQDSQWYAGLDLLDRSIYRQFAKYRGKLDSVELRPQVNLPGLRLIKSGKNSGLNGPDFVCEYNQDSYLKVDVFLPVFHGEIYEDGCLQGLFELAAVNYTGFNHTASTIAMNKQLMKSLCAVEEINVLPGKVIEKFNFLKDPDGELAALLDCHEFQEFPIFVKPCNRGSSVGISKVNSRSELAPALLKVFHYDLEALVEPFLAKMFEINVAVLGGDTPRASVVEIPNADAGFLSYEDKYMKGSKKTGESSGMEDLSRAINPVDLDEGIKKQVQDAALKICKLINAQGNCRIDFMYDTSAEKLYFNEINPFPGSGAFYLWAESEPPLLYTEIIDHLIQLAIKEGQAKASVERSFGFKAL